VTPPIATIPQPNFLAQQIPADLNAPGLHSMALLNMQPPMSRVSVPADSISLNDPDDPFGFGDGPRDNLARQRVAGEYRVDIVIPPEVQLPANLNAPLQHPMPVVSPMPIRVPLRVRRGPRGRGRTPPNISGTGRQSDPVLDGLRHGHIACRGQAANHHADVQILLQQRQQQQEQLAERLRVERDQRRQADLQHHAEQQMQQQQQDDEQRRREERHHLDWARERQREAQLAFEEEERQNLEVHQRGVNYMRRQEELEAHTRNRWRNEQQAQEQLQNDEAEEERRRWQEERELIRRQQRLEEVSITHPE
jgi:hypothetical protein